MSFWNWVKSGLPGLRERRKKEAELERELQSHLELEAEEQQAGGLSAGDARYAARRALGNVTLVHEDVRAVWSPLWLEGVLRDLRYAARSLRKSPGFTVVAVLTLSLGIGANTAIFTTMDALMLRPLPFSNPDQLVRLSATKNGRLAGETPSAGPSPLDVRDYAAATHSFQNMVAYDAWRKNVSFGGTSAEPEQMRVGLVPAAYFETLEIQPILGRLFAEQENQQGNNYVAAITAHVWKTRFSSDAAILGRQLRINDELYTIVAV